MKRFCLIAFFIVASASSVFAEACRLSSEECQLIAREQIMADIQNDRNRASLYGMTPHSREMAIITMKYDYLRERYKYLPVIIVNEWNRMGGCDEQKLRILARNDTDGSLQKDFDKQCGSSQVIEDAPKPKPEPNQKIISSNGSDKLDGWWGFSPDGCFDDVDNQYRVALGRFEVINSDKDRKILFGKGAYGIGMYDGGCSLTQSKKSNAEITFKAQCTSEGEKTTGLASIKFDNEFTLRLYSPITRKDGLLLVKCGKLSRKEIIDGKGN
jgi:hypothetical protein